MADSIRSGAARAHLEAGIERTEAARAGSGIIHLAAGAEPLYLTINESFFLYEEQSSDIAQTISESFWLYEGLSTDLTAEISEYFNLFEGITKTPPVNFSISEQFYFYEALAESLGLSISESIELAEVTPTVQKSVLYSWKTAIIRKLNENTDLLPMVGSRIYPAYLADIPNASFPCVCFASEGGSKPVSYLPFAVMSIRFWAYSQTSFRQSEDMIEYVQTSLNNEIVASKDGTFIFYQMSEPVEVRSGSLKGLTGAYLVRKVG